MAVKSLGLWSLDMVIFYNYHPIFAYSGLWWLIFIRILMGLGEGITFLLGMQFMQGGFLSTKELELLLLLIAVLLQEPCLVMQRQL